MKTTIASAPPAPAPVDAGQSALDYTKDMASPELQQLLFNSEQQFRPQYTQLNLQDMNDYLMGVGGQPGTLAQLGNINAFNMDQQNAANTSQRTSDIANVEQLGQRATAAFQNANPDLMNSVRSAQGLQGGDPYAAYRAAISPQNDYASYVRNNPDLMKNWTDNASKNTQLTIDQYGKQHYDSAGRQEGRQITQTQGGKSFGDINFNPAQASLLGNAPQVASQNINASQAGGGLLGMSLYGQALNANGLGQLGSQLQGRGMELAKSNGAMTPDELRAMQQDIRSSYGARGVLDGSGSVSAEALGRLTNERQNMMNNLAMAGTINSQNQAELGANRQFAQGVQGAELGRQFQNVGNDLQAQQQNQQAALQAALANQQMSGQYGLANQSAANQYGLYNNQAGLATQEANRNFNYGMYNDQLKNLGILGQFDASNLAGQRNYALQLAQMQSGMASDPFQAILGRSSGVLGMGQGTQGMAGQYTQQLQGPQLFDPNAGINLALGNAANQGSYNAATYGAQAAAQGASNASWNSMLGSIGGAATKGIFGLIPTK